MIPSLGLVQRLILTALLGGAIGTAVATVWWYVGRQRLRQLRPAPRLRRLVAMALAPLLGAAGMVGIVLLPSILHPLGIAADHCAAHPSHHVHLCLLHGSHGRADPVGWLILGLAVGWFGMRAGPVLLEQWRANRSLAALDASARELSARKMGGSECRLVDSDFPFAVAVGLFAPRVLISAGLREALAERQLRIVRAHERAHARRFHILLQLFVELTGLLHLPSIRSYLDDEVGLACEQIADREAAAAADGEVAVADTILDVEKRVGAADPQAADARLATGPGIEGSDLERRIRGLLEEPWRTVARSRLVVTAITAGTTAVWIVGSYASIHHAVETFLSVVV